MLGEKHGEAIMGTAKEQLARWRERRRVAQLDLNAYKAGKRWFYKNIDISDNLIAKARWDIDYMDSLISACEAENTNRT
jgi:hypothetical protein